MKPYYPSFFCLLAFCLSLSLEVNAQDRPIILPEDVEHNTLELKCYFCKPGIRNKTRSRGVEIAYNFTQGGQVKEEEDGTLVPPFSEVNYLRNLIFKLKVPFLNRDGVKILGGFAHQTERYKFDLIGPSFNEVFDRIGSRLLKNTSFSLMAIKPIDDKQYISGQYKVNFNGDYPGLAALRSRYLAQNISALYGRKLSDDFEWGVGFSFSTNFRRTITFIPFFLYNRNFNDKWGIEMVLPAFVHGRYNISNTTILSFGPKYNSRSYSIDVVEGAIQEKKIFGMNHSEVLLMISLERKLHPWIWFHVEGGYQVNFSTDFETLEGSDNSFQVELQNAPYLRIGIFIAPPDDYL